MSETYLFHCQNEFENHYIEVTSATLCCIKFKWKTAIYFERELYCDLEGEYVSVTPYGCLEQLANLQSISTADIDQSRHALKSMVFMFSNIIGSESNSRDNRIGGGWESCCCL